MSQTQETPSFQELKALALYAFVLKTARMQQLVCKCRLSLTINTDLSVHKGKANMKPKVSELNPIVSNLGTIGGKSKLKLKFL